MRRKQKPGFYSRLHPTLGARRFLYGKLVMKLAVNYSPQSSLLFRGGNIKLDLFKCPDWPDLITAALKEQATYVHFSLATLTGNLSQANWQQILHFLTLTGTQNINLHLLTEPSIDPDDRSQTNKAIQLIIGLVNQVIDQFGPDRVILENTPMTMVGRDYLRPIVDPQTISLIIEKTGCRLLLDLSHAVISAAEVHITGMTLENGQLVDHRAMRAEDWPIFEWALSQIRSGSWSEPNIIAFEYSGFGKIFQPYSDPKVLEAQVPQLYRMVHPEENDRQDVF
jgi:hypothetical protein